MKKNTLRNHLLLLRKNIPYDTRIALTTSANTNLIEFIQTKIDDNSLKNIALFHSFRDEIDTSLTINYLLEKEITVCLPIIHPINHTHLLFQSFDKTTEMVKNKFGILEPKLNVNQIIIKESIDLIILPLTGYDEMGNRLGMGGGFYDRTFEHYPFKERLIGFAFSIQKVGSIPAEPWDLKIARIISDEP
ncbi:5-formyltetrahydrofolate cyclo-ligase [Thorsellia kenyensis]|uniref:5-formyltetrahydrofolate cyclo-ligase n=1 Tax=Thorsellia kenyensis TaxID=1549888 RepID=A0ABV6C6P0_9GAMM